MINTTIPSFGWRNDAMLANDVWSYFTCNFAHASPNLLLVFTAWGSPYSYRSRSWWKQEVPCPSFGPRQLLLGIWRLILEKHLWLFYQMMLFVRVIWFSWWIGLHCHILMWIWQLHINCLCQFANLCYLFTGVSRKARIIDVVYNASNNELVRTKTLVKNAIIVVDATPFRQWYEGHYAIPLGRKKGAKLVCSALYMTPTLKWWYILYLH